MALTPHTGLQLDGRKQRTRDLAITAAPVPDKLRLPLDQHGASVVLNPRVQVGDCVYVGQVIATPSQPLGAYLHASVSGKVLAIEPYPAQRGGITQSIVIQNDRLEQRDVNNRPLERWRELSALQLCEHLSFGGIVGLGGAAFPTATKLAAHQTHSIDTLIINGVECEPYITCDDRLMREHADAILQGVQILLQASQAPRCIIALESDKPEARQALHAALQTLNDARITLQSVPTAYPSGDEGQLIARLLQREIPRQRLPAEIGVIVHNVATAYACEQWLIHGEPLISRVVTVTGAGVAAPGNFQVRIGTSIQTLLQQCGAEMPTTEIIVGGPMMGQSLIGAEHVITKSSNCVIVAAANELATRQAEQPCIRCGECMHACPVGLLPQQLLMHAEQHNALALQQLGLRDCIECGCCDYVCPSQLQLSQRFHLAKLTI